MRQNSLIFKGLSCLVLLSSLSSMAFAEPLMTGYLDNSQQYLAFAPQGEHNMSSKKHPHGPCGIMDQLNLSPEQKSKLKAKMATRRANWKAQKDSGAERPHFTPEQRKAHHQEMRKNMQAILTPEQFQKFELLRGQCREKHKTERQGKNKA